MPPTKKAIVLRRDNSITANSTTLSRVAVTVDDNKISYEADVPLFGHVDDNAVAKKLSINAISQPQTNTSTKQQHKQHAQTKSSIAQTATGAASTSGEDKAPIMDFMQAIASANNFTIPPNVKAEVVGGKLSSVGGEIAARSKVATTIAVAGMNTSTDEVASAREREGRDDEPTTPGGSTRTNQTTSDAAANSHSSRAGSSSKAKINSQPLSREQPYQSNNNDNSSQIILVELAISNSTESELEPIIGKAMKQEEALAVDDANWVQAPRAGGKDECTIRGDTTGKRMKVGGRHIENSNKQDDVMRDDEVVLVQQVTNMTSHHLQQQMSYGQGYPAHHAWYAHQARASQQQHGHEHTRHRSIPRAAWYAAQAASQDQGTEGQPNEGQSGKGVTGGPPGAESQEQVGRQENSHPAWYVKAAGQSAEGQEITPTTEGRVPWYPSPHTYHQRSERLDSHPQQQYPHAQHAQQKQQWNTKHQHVVYADYCKQYQIQHAKWLATQQQQQKKNVSPSNNKDKNDGTSSKSPKKNEHSSNLKKNDGAIAKENGLNPSQNMSSPMNDDMSSTLKKLPKKSKDRSNQLVAVHTMQQPPPPSHADVNGWNAYHYWHAHTARGYHAYHQHQHAHQQAGQGQQTGTAAVNAQQSHAYPYWQQYPHIAYHAVKKAASAAVAQSQQAATATPSQATKKSRKEGKKSEDSTTASSMTASVAASVGTTGSKKRSRDETEADEQMRDDVNTKSSFFSEDGRLDDNNETEEDGRSDDGLSLGGFISLGSLGRVVEHESSSGKRHKGLPCEVHSSTTAARSQSIYRPTAAEQFNDGNNNMKLLQVSSTLSEGKMILKNLSIDSNYSAEFADIAGVGKPSPTAVSSSNVMGLATLAAARKDRIDAEEREQSNGQENKVEDDDYETDDGQGKTPKKKNTSNKKNREPPVVHSYQDRITSMSINTSHDSKDSSSPTMFDLIGGAETPTTGMLMNSIMESALNDEIRSLNGHLRGQSFTPLPMMMSDNVSTGGSGSSGTILAMGQYHHHSGDLSITPQLSWGTANTDGDPSPPLEITPRCFGPLESTKSSRSGSFHPLGSPKSFWKESGVLDKCAASMDSAGKEKYNSSILSLLSPTMREMKVVQNENFDDLEGGEDGTIGRSHSPLPLYGQENSNNVVNWVDPPKNYKTPARRPPTHDNDPSGAASAAQQRMVHIHGAMSPWGFAASPIPGSGATSPFMYHPNMFHPQPAYTASDDNERVRNLRGNGPPRHQMPPQHHLPPPSYHHYSPLTNGQPSYSRNGARGANSQPHMYPHQLDMVMGTTSKRKCIPIKPPIPTKFQGDKQTTEEVAAQSLPEFNSLVNFPGHMNSKPCSNLPDGMKCCVMCGQACPCTSSGKSKSTAVAKNEAKKKHEAKKKKAGKGGDANDILAPLGDSTGNNENTGGIVPSSSSSVNSQTTTSQTTIATIPTQNKGLCTICDVNVWVVTQTGMEIKWCKGCKNFRPWAAFGDKGLATKCVKCRNRQREKYAMQKEAKERKRGSDVRRKVKQLAEVEVGGQEGSL